MGYYSRFTINIPDDIPEETGDLIAETITEVSEYEPEWFNGEMIIDGKWYDWKSDMTTVSGIYPEWTFEVEQVGEDGDGEKIDFKGGSEATHYKRGWVPA